MCRKKAFTLIEFLVVIAIIGSVKNLSRFCLEFFHWSGHPVSASPPWGWKSYRTKPRRPAIELLAPFLIPVDGPCPCTASYPIGYQQYA